MNLFPRRRQKRLPGRADTPTAPPNHNVSGSRRQWRTMILTLAAVALIIYSLGSINGLLLVNRTAIRRAASTPLVYIATTATPAPTATLDAAARAEMQATESAMIALSAANKEAVATQNAIDLKLADAVANATIHAIAINSSAFSQTVQMDLNVRTIQHANEQTRADILNYALIGVLVLCGCGLTGYAMTALGSGSQLALLNLQSAVNFQLKAPKQPTLLTNTQHRQTPKRDKPTREPLEVEEVETEPDDVEEIEPEETESIEPQPDRHITIPDEIVEGNFEPIENPPPQIVAPRPRNTHHTFTLQYGDQTIEMRWPLAINAKMWDLCNRLCETGKFSKRERAPLTESQYKTLHGIWLDAGLITQEPSKPVVFTEIGEAFYRSYVQPNQLPNPLD